MLKWAWTYVRNSVPILRAMIGLWICAVISMGLFFQATAQSSFFNPDDPPSAFQRDILDNPILRQNVDDFKGDQICLTLPSCLNILDNHTAKSFDFDLLAADLDRFGTQAQSELLERLFNEKNALGPQALTALARSKRLLPPNAQRRMVAMWRELSIDKGPSAKRGFSTDDFARLMTRHMSPMVRAGIIDSLVSANADVRRASHVLLGRIGSSNMDMPLRPGDIKKIAQALEHFPHPSLAGILAKDQSLAAEAVLAKGLNSKDVDTVAVFYQTLYERDRERAFRALVSTLYALEADKSKNALALAEVLRRRHTGRADGFYMSFANDLIQDEDMSPMGRAVGLDAALRNSPSKIAGGASVLQSYRLALKAQASQGTIPSAYYDAAARFGRKSPDNWLSALAELTQKEDLRGQIRLTQIAGTFDTPFARGIARSALEDHKDHRRFMAGLFALTAQAQTPADRQALNAFMSEVATEHPMTRVRQAADLSLRALKSKNPREKLRALKPQSLARLNKTQRFCTVKNYDFISAAKAMPYFSGGRMSRQTPVMRGWLRSAHRIPGGWLAGYSAPNGEGALIAYTIETGAHEKLLAYAPTAHQNIRAILPFAPPELGQKESSFWVVGGIGNDAALYRLVNTGNGLDIRLALILPSVPSAIAPGGLGEIIMAFGQENPPLKFSDKDGLSRGCENKSASQNGRGIVLP